MLAPVRIPTLNQRYAIVNTDRTPDKEFLRYFNGALQQLTQAINGGIEADNNAQAAQASADAAQASGDGAQVTANSALALANTKVTKNVGPVFAAVTGTASRATFAVYSAPTITNPPTQAEVQAIANAVQTLGQHFKALVDDLRANGALAT